LEDLPHPVITTAIEPTGRHNFYEEASDNMPKWWPPNHCPKGKS